MNYVFGQREAIANDLSDLGEEGGSLIWRCLFELAVMKLMIYEFVAVSVMSLPFYLSNFISRLENKSSPTCYR